MATYPTFSEIGDGGGYAVPTSDTSLSNAGQNVEPDYTVVAFDPEDTGLGDQDRTTRTGHFLPDGIDTTDYSVSNLGQTIQPTYVLVEFEPESLGQGDQERKTRTGFTETDGIHTGATEYFRHLSQFIQPTTQIIPFDPHLELGTAGFIPAAHFRLVQGRVWIADEDEPEPLREAIWLVAVGPMATASTVDEDGFFQMFMLNQRYTDFFVAVHTGTDQPDYTWYGSLDMNDPVVPGQGWADLYFSEEYVDIPPPTGLIIGHGVTMG